MSRSTITKIVLSTTLVVGALVWISRSVSAAPEGASFKLGYVNLQEALQSVEAGKKAKGQLEKDMTAKRTDLEKQQQALQKEAEQFEKKAAIMNDSAKIAKQGELQKKFSELQKAAAESQMDLQKRERELTKPIIDELRSIVEGLGKTQDFHLVLEKNEGAVLYAKNGIDLTKEVIEAFNTRAKKKRK